MERRDLGRIKLLSRRAAVIGGVKIGLLGALAARLYYLQVLQSDQYAMLAEDNRISMRLLAPPRGRILDRFGREIASNRRNYRVLLVAEQTSSVAGTLARLGELMPIDEGQRARVLREVARKRKFMPVMVAENLSWEDFARINIHSPELPGIQLDVGETRDYPFGPLFAHVAGYVAAVSQQDLSDNDDPLLDLPGFRIGKSGAERVYDLDLRGRAGDSRIEVNAYGRVIRELARQDGEPGSDLRLTIDADLQRFAYERMNGESGAVVVLDVLTGDVLTLVSSPGFDPNWFNVGITGEQWRQLNTDKYRPLINKTIQGQYPPGSTFKMMVALAGLETGTITPEHRVSCPGQVTLGNATFHCWKKGGHGSLSLLQGIEQSCDVYFYDVARRLGPDRIAEMARRFGLGQPTRIDLPNERGGLIPTREWKMAALGQAWSAGESLVIGIGQGYVLATPLQLAVMAARIANGGHAVEPRLVRGDDPGREAALARGVPLGPSLGISPAALNVVVQGMIQVTNSQRGTAYGARIKIAGQEMAGKTGTSQVRRITKSERESGAYKRDDKPWEERDHAVFVGFASLGRPRYACAVLIEHGGGGSKAAAPVARDVLIEAQRLDSARRPGERLAGPAAGRHAEDGRG
jgi:penicillin-binding protein 2